MAGQQVSGDPTGASAPANAFYTGLLGASGNLEGSQSVRQTVDGATGNGIASQQPYVYNGTTFDRTRSANGASNTTGTGLLGVGNMIFDGTNWQRQTSTTNIGNVGITDGTNTANVLKSDGTAAGQNAQLVAPAYKEVASLTAGALNADLVPSTDVSGYSTFVLQVVGTWVGTLTLQGSNDNTNFVSVYGTWISNTQPVAVMSTNGVMTGSCNFRYFRVRMTAYTSGTATGTLELKTVPFTPTNISGQVNATSTPVTARATGNITTSSSSITSASATGYSWAYVTISGTYAGISFGITTSDNGGTNYYNVPVWDIQNQKYIAPGATISPTDNSSSSYYVPQSATSSTVRVLATAYTSGTGAVAITGMSNTPFLPPSGTTGTTSAVVNVGQQTSNTSAVQLSSTSTVPTNGIVIEALIGNAAVVYIGGSGVTTSTGFQLSPGQSLTLTCNLNTIYVIGSNATDKVCWSVA